MSSARRFDFVDDFEWYAGDTINQVIEFRLESEAPLDLTDSEWLMQVRDKDNNVLLAFNSEASPATIEIDGVNGRVTLKQSASVMKLQTWASAMYDLQQIGPDDDISAGQKVVKTWLYGRIDLRQDVSRVA
jgi:hypothetical protein